MKQPLRGIYIWSALNKNIKSQMMWFIFGEDDILNFFKEDNPELYAEYKSTYITILGVHH